MDKSKADEAMSAIETVAKLGESAAQWLEGQEVIDDGEVHAVVVNGRVEIWNYDHTILYGKLSTSASMDDVTEAVRMYFNGFSRGRSATDKEIADRLRSLADAVECGTGDRLREMLYKHGTAPGTNIQY